jgi:hypothetical protein
MTQSHDITNADRANRCNAALTAYNDDYDNVANLVDFLADARHWCDVHGLSFGDLDRIAYQHYLEECSAERRSS